MFYLGKIAIHVYDNWFGFIYDGILAISARLYYTLVIGGPARAFFYACTILFVLYPFFKLLINSGVIFSREGGLLDITDKMLKSEFYFKAFIAGMLLILMLSEVDVTLVKSTGSVNSMIPSEISKILIQDGLGFKDSDNYMRCSDKQMTGINGVAKTMSECTYAQPAILGIPLFFVDTLYNYITAPMAYFFGLSSSDNVSDGSYAQVNVDVFDKFVNGMLNSGEQVSIFDNLGTMISKAVQIGHPLVFPSHNVHDYYNESDTLIPKTQETFKVPKSSGVSGFLSNLFSSTPDDESVSKESATLYTILAKFNYLMLYNGSYDSIYGDVKESSTDAVPENTPETSSLSNVNLEELKQDLSKFLTGESLDPSSYFTFENGKNKLRALVPNNFVEDKGFNFNKYATFENILLTHPEIVELFAVILSWYKQLVLPVSELEELNKVMTQCSDTNKKANMFDMVACKFNFNKKVNSMLDTLSEKNSESVLSSGTSVSIESKALHVGNKETSFYYWNADKETYDEVMNTYLYSPNSYFNSISKLDTSESEGDNNKIIIENAMSKQGDIYKYIMFLRLLLSNHANKSIYGFALTQIFMNQSLNANLFNTGKKEMEYKQDYFNKISELLTSQAKKTENIVLLTNKYLKELRSLNNLIIAIQTEGAMTDNFGLKIDTSMIKKIDAAGMSYLLQTIRYWEEVNNVAKNVNGTLAGMKEFLSVLLDTNDTYNVDGVKYASGDLDSNMQSLQISKTNNLINQDTSNLLFYFLKILMDISDVDRTNDNQAFSSTMSKPEKGFGDLTIVLLIKGLVWFLYFILTCVTIFLLFYFLIQRLIAFTIFFLLWPVLFLKSALLGTFKDTIGGFFSSWASFRCFDFAFLIGYIFVSFMSKFNTVTAIYATRLFDGYTQDSIRTMSMFIAVISMLVSILLIRFIYTRLAQLLTNKFDVIADSLGKVADMAMAQSGAIASIGASGMRTIGSLAGGLMSLIPVLGSIAGAGTQIASNVAAKGAEQLNKLVNKPPEG